MTQIVLLNHCRQLDGVFIDLTWPSVAVKEDAVVHREGEVCELDVSRSSIELRVCCKRKRKIKLHPALYARSMRCQLDVIRRSILECKSMQ
jgi:hypothetical protein